MTIPLLTTRQLASLGNFRRIYPALARLALSTWAGNEGGGDQLYCRLISLYADDAWHTLTVTTRALVADPGGTWRGLLHRSRRRTYYSKPLVMSLLGLCRLDVWILAQVKEVVQPLNTLQISQAGAPLKENELPRQIDGRLCTCRPISVLLSTGYRLPTRYVTHEPTIARFVLY